MSYTVRRGDTLWGISAHFFENPWLWPEIWYENPYIANPHLIYPGDVITLGYANGHSTLTISRNGTTVATTIPGTRMLRPQIERTPLDKAVPTIPYDAISALLSKPRVMSAADYAAAPYVLRPADGQLLAAAPGLVYARGLGSDDHPGTGYAVVRQENALKDPASGRLLGYEVLYLGRASVTAAGDPSTLELQTSTREVRGGDRLVALETGVVPSQFPLLTPKTRIHAAIIDVIGGLAEVGQYQVVVLDRGTRAGLETGDVLAIYTHGKAVKDPYAHAGLSAKVRLPDRRSGELVVFRSSPEISYALVMRALRPIKIGDITTNP
ncbi:MAG: LysM peptidoglycan-binding domain-containing protein [Gammaproteobacteria bacterium]